MCYIPNATRYFFGALEVDLSDTLLVRGVDEKGEVIDHPDEIQAAYELGRRLVAEE
jgi:hypothetical protein